MVTVEECWLAGLAACGIAPSDAAADLTQLITPADLPHVAEAAEGGGNPVIEVLRLLRQRLGDINPTAAHWVHRGLTSQDVLDTALVLGLREALTTVNEELRAQISATMTLVETHRHTVMAGRTLSQHAVPTTFGRKAASWLDGLLEAAEDIDAAEDRLAAQFGGAAGTMAAGTELARQCGATAPERTAWQVAEYAATQLGLPMSIPWHTNRARITRSGDALVRACDAWGHIAQDVLVMSRTEIAELSEPTGDGRGGSSAMPQKVNPVLSVLLSRTSLIAPHQAAQLHLAAAQQVDERAVGGWHAEWPALQTLVRGTIAAARHATELLSGLRVHGERMTRRAVEAGEDLLAEQRAIIAAAGSSPPASDLASAAVENYLGAADLIVSTVLGQAERYLREKA